MINLIYDNYNTLLVICIFFILISYIPINNIYYDCPSSSTLHIQNLQAPLHRPKKNKWQRVVRSFLFTMILSMNFIIAINYNTNLHIDIVEYNHDAVLATRTKLLTVGSSLLSQVSTEYVPSHI